MIRLRRRLPESARCRTHLCPNRAGRDELLCGPCRDTETTNRRAAT